MRIPGYMIERIERTERKKFKKIPKVIMKKRVGAGVAREEVKRTWKGNKIETVRSAKIYMTKKFAQEYQKPFVGAILMHEARESLHLQHGSDRGKGRRSPSAHRKAARWEKKDELFLKRRGIK